MHKQLLLRLSTILLLLIGSLSAKAQWTNLDTGIDDNLTGAVFLGQNALASGASGLYFTTTGGQGATSWTRFEITDNATNSAIYENTSFTHCYSDRTNTTSTGIVYACGRDNATTKAVLFKITIPSMAYEIIYQGPPDSKLNKIDGNSGGFLAVGDDGLVIGFTGSTVTLIDAGLTEDLTSVGIFQGKALIGANQKMYYASWSTTSLGTTTLLNTPGVNNKDVALVSLNIANSVSSDKFSYVFYTPPTQQHDTNENFYGTLDANGLFVLGSIYYIATAHGIYKTTGGVFANTSVEWQLSSLNLPINDFWLQSGGTFYAFGSNGVILKTTNNGGPTKPYVRITSEGGCFGGSTNLRAITGSANSYNWYLNSNLIQTGSNNFYYTFPSAGAYEVTVTVQNSAGETGTDTKTIHMVNVPLINKPFTVSDDILCKEETIQIQIADSQPNVFYTLKIEGDPNSNFGESAAGNGGMLNFTTDMIGTTGNYYLYAKSSLADCGDRFTGSFAITVEETKAEFHAGVINAEVGELVKFSNNAVDAQHFDWQFSNGASPATSGAATPQVAFNTTGSVTTTLHAWSDNDCHDTVTADKTNVFQLPSNPSDCLFLVNNSHDPDWPGYYNRDISQMVPTSDGFLICGTYFDEIFDSKYGVVKEMPDQKGGFLAKYDLNGVIKWVVYNINTQNGDVNEDVFYSTAVDADGNIYISGHGQGKFIDNAGKETYLSPMFGELEYFLIKLNPNGELIWYTQNNVLPLAKLAIDKENNVVALSGLYDFDYDVFLYFNGQLVGEITTQDVPATFAILKFSPSGTLIWDTKIDLYSANTRELNDVGFDSANNIYFSAAFDIWATVYQPGSTTVSQTIMGDGSYGSKIGLFKLDENGTFIWKLRSRTTNSAGQPSDHTELHAMVVEDDGTIYLTGQNNTGQNSLGFGFTNTHYIESTDGSTISTQNGEYFLARVNSDGVCQWLRAAGGTYYGLGTQILKSGNEIHVVGHMSDNGPESCTGYFDSADGLGYDLTINVYDYFVAVYTDTGILKRVFVNNEGGNAAYAFEDMPGFFKTGDHFYLAKNVQPMIGGEIFHDFGMVSPPLNGREGTVVRFEEECGVLKFSKTLGIDQTEAFAQLTLVPNPTTGAFTIDLKQLREEVSVTISDIAGKILSEQEFGSTAGVSTQVSGTTGIYFVRLKTADGEKTFKVIKN